jgi:hypothetical protein
MTYFRMLWGLSWQRRYRKLEVTKLLEGLEDMPEGAGACP